jgi:hypothetical protein
MIYPVVSVGTKPPIVHIVEAHHTRVLLLGHQVSPKSAPLDLPQRLATKPLTKIPWSP